MDERANAVRELRLVVTTDDYDAALRFYRDVLGLREQASFESNGGRLTILEAATRAAKAAGAEVIAEPTRTPWDSLNSRLAAPGGLQLTLFEELSG